jgi:hypothetical protein
VANYDSVADGEAIVAAALAACTPATGGRAIESARRPVYSVACM